MKPHIHLVEVIIFSSFGVGSGPPGPLGSGITAMLSSLPKVLTDPSTFLGIKVLFKKEIRFFARCKSWFSHIVQKKIHKDCTDFQH